MSRKKIRIWERRYGAVKPLRDAANQRRQVMVPNVFGMGLTGEDGIFTSKAYICGSNYVMKMGDFRRAAWRDVMDGLLWRFVAQHEATLKANQRLAPMVANLPRAARRRPEIFARADRFVEEHTRAV